VTCPPGDFGRLAQADMPTVAITTSDADAKDKAQLRRDLTCHIAPHKAKDNAASSTPSPPGVPRGNSPDTGTGAAAVQNVFTTIATFVPFPVRVIEFGTIWQVMFGEGLVHPSVTLPVVPGVDVSSKPKTAPPPGVVLAVPGVPGVTEIVTGELLLLNVAVTASVAFMVTEQPPVPLHPAPLQPAKVEPSAGDAVSATTCPLAKLAEQVG
jgi:hypothetical protein